MTRSIHAAGGRGAAAFGLAALSLLALGLSAVPARADQGTGAAGPGTWQQHKMSFQFMGFTSTYSCDGLADKLRTLLLVAGARPDVKAEPGACASGFGRPDKFARADLTFYTLEPAQGSGASAPGTVAGSWRSVALSAHSPQDLQLGDCELVDQFRTQVLKSFTTQDLVNHTTCIPFQESGSVIDLRFEAFAAPRTPGAPPAR